ncbi:MAG: response regulator [Deltaproteobacteria bacterium]
MSYSGQILLVDDEVDFIQTMSTWLVSKGFSVILANNGASALKMIKENVPDLVILDLKMPLMDGVQVLKKIRQSNKNLPVLIMTAHLEHPGALEVDYHGISGVFYKGDEFTEILPLIESALKTNKK